MTNDSFPTSSLDYSDRGNKECPYIYDLVWRQEYLTNVTSPYLVAGTVINLLAILPTFLLNALVIVAVATRHRLQSKCDGNGRSNGRSNPKVVGSGFPPRSKDFSFTSCGSLIPFTKANAQWVIHEFI